jgi:hypothetical protein
MYIAVPFALHVGERTLRAFRSKAYAAKILKVIEHLKVWFSVDAEH